MLAFFWNKLFLPANMRVLSEFGIWLWINNFRFFKKQQATLQPLKAALLAYKSSLIGFSKQPFCLAKRLLWEANSYAFIGWKHNDEESKPDIRPPIPRLSSPQRAISSILKCRNPWAFLDKTETGHKSNGSRSIDHDVGTLDDDLELA